MQLTLINFFKRTVPGHIFRGKKRLVKQVSRRSMDTMIREFELQEKNMLLLRNPYLSVEQSSGHAKALNKQENKLKFWNNNPIKPPLKDHVKIADRLAHLNVKSVWE
ncbi:unnamed protein product [Diamesa hyperborea]